MSAIDTILSVYPSNTARPLAGGGGVHAASQGGVLEQRIDATLTSMRTAASMTLTPPQHISACDCGHNAKAWLMGRGMALALCASHAIAHLDAGASPVCIRVYADEDLEAAGVAYGAHLRACAAWEAASPNRPRERLALVGLEL